MSDTSQGPGWWQASNGRWYPPQAKPGREHRPNAAPHSRETRPARETRRNAAGPRGSKPGVQEPFVFRKMEPLDLDREEEKSRRPRRGLNLDRPNSRPVKQWLGIGALTLVSVLVVFVGVSRLLSNSDDNGESEANVTNSSNDALRNDEDSGQNQAALTTEGTEVLDSKAGNSDELEDSVTSVFDLATGDCFSPAVEAEEEPIILALVHIFDCEDAHLAEVIKTTALSGEKGSTYPGNAARDAESQRICQDAFEDYVGHTLARSELGLLWLGPTEATWAEQDDRALTCAVQALDGFPLIGSVKDSQR